MVCGAQKSQAKNKHWCYKHWQVIVLCHIQMTQNSWSSTGTLSHMLCLTSQSEDQYMITAHKFMLKYN